MEWEISFLLTRFAFHNETVSTASVDLLLRCLFVNELKQYDRRPRWSAQECRKAAVDFRLNVFNELKRRMQDA